MKKKYQLGFPIITLILIVGILSNIVSCNDANKTKQESDTLLLKNISFPKELFILEKTKLKKPDSLIQIIDKKKKIVSIIDGNCVKCVVMQLNKLDSIFNSILTVNNEIYITILNVPNQDSAYFMQNIQPFIKAKGIILWDNNYHFESRNKLFTPHINLRTFMINSDNRVVLFGNPLIHSDILHEYKKKLVSLNK